MNSQNVLITSAGKRVELLLEFKKELKDKNPNARILAVDYNPKMSPACHMADGCFALPRVLDPEYITLLLDICKNNNIRIVIPTIDTELLTLSMVRDEFVHHGIEIMVSNVDFIKICRDKRLTMQLFEKVGIRIPAPRDKHNPLFPMFAKPYDGSLSANIHLLRGPEDMTPEILADEKLMFMEYIDKTVYKEYTVDMYYGADHRLKSIVPRERIEIRAGEVNKGATRKNNLVDYLYKRMEYMPGVRGCICMQVFYNAEGDDVVGIEINPRFGGGYPLSYYAGANYPAMMIQEYICGNDVKYSKDWHDNTVMLRYDSQVIVQE